MLAYAVNLGAISREAATKTQEATLAELSSLLDGLNGLERGVERREASGLSGIPQPNAT